MFPTGHEVGNQIRIREMTPAIRIRAINSPMVSVVAGRTACRLPSRSKHDWAADRFRRSGFVVGEPTDDHGVALGE